MQKNTQQTVTRSPVVSVLGHIDHGKSTLLDYIRKTNIVDKEAGGITQKISAYEVVLGKAGEEKKITFLDTPGHEAFQKMRERGAGAADIAILVVSAEDGVKKQTLEAYAAIVLAKVPFVVAITKTDKPNANIERVKLSLAENSIYLEGYGGQISYIPVSAKTGDGIQDLLDLILLTAEVADLKGNPAIPAIGYVIETTRDSKRGIGATLIIKDGTLRVGNCIVSGESVSPVRAILDFTGKRIEEAGPSQPVFIAGWDIAPEAGQMFETCESKKEAETKVVKKEAKKNTVYTQKRNEAGEKIETAIIPVVIKANSKGSLEAIEHELSKIKHERIDIRIILKGVGDISEADIKILSGNLNAVVLGFDVNIDSQAKSAAERTQLKIETFDIIYKLAEWLEVYSKELVPKITVEEVVGEAKIMKFFSKNKDKQIVGGKVIKGSLSLGHKIKIFRRDVEISDGVVRELQQQKEKTSEVREGYEFGTMIECKLEIAPGDIIKDIVMVEKQ